MDSYKIGMRYEVTVKLPDVTRIGVEYKTSCEDYDVAVNAAKYACEMMPGATAIVVRIAEEVVYATDVIRGFARM